MKRGLWALALAGLLVVSAGRLGAVSSPIIEGDVFGVELCEQAVCGAAIFVGIYHGQLGANPNGYAILAVAVTHDPLPDPGQFAAITGGVWQLKNPLRHIRGIVAPAPGGLYNNGDNTFAVQALLGLTSGGSGAALFQGLLDHNVFPPTIAGHISQ